jgi:hypothetical protein
MEYFIEIDKCPYPDEVEEALIVWSGRSDSNTRPLAPHASTLPGCATPRLTLDYISSMIWNDLRVFANHPIY